MPHEADFGVARAGPGRETPRVLCEPKGELQMRDISAAEMLRVRQGRDTIAPEGEAWASRRGLRSTCPGFPGATELQGTPGRQSDGRRSYGRCQVCTPGVGPPAKVLIV